MITADFNNVISSDASNDVARRICEIEGDDDELTISFVDVDFSILRRVP